MFFWNNSGSLNVLPGTFLELWIFFLKHKILSEIFEYFRWLSDYFLGLGSWNLLNFLKLFLSWNLPGTFFECFLELFEYFLKPLNVFWNNTSWNSWNHFTNTSWIRNLPITLFPVTLITGTFWIISWRFIPPETPWIFLETF